MLLGFELWFVAAVGAAVLGGLSNFFFKVAAKHNHHSELFIFFTGLFSIIFVGAALLVFPKSLFDDPLLSIGVFGFGFLAGFAGVMKVNALRYIDSTIYFPLLKLLAPALTIVAGVSLFSETFSSLEWLGMALGLFVPLMLITKSENQRQNNLLKGLILVVATSLISAAVATANNFAVDSGIDPVVVLFYAVCGVFSSSALLFVYRQGVRNIALSVANHSSGGLLLTAALRSLFVALSVWLVNYSYSIGGTLAMVQVVYSMYILVTVFLAIAFYNEHWNIQKVVAIILSVAALALLG